jgi:hypothetical protein
VPGEGVGGVIGPYQTPWLLEEITAPVRRFVHMGEEQLLAVGLWTLFTWVVDVFDVAPYIDVSSPVRECGKTRLFEVLEHLVQSPRRCTGHTEATLFRMIEAEHPTLLLDEIDTTFGKDPKLYAGIRGVLDEGHRRGGRVPRMVGEGSKMQLKYFDVFGPKAFAGIGALPETIASRSIPIRLHRKPRSVSLARFRPRSEHAATTKIREAAEEWAGNVRDHLADVEPELPEELSDRQWDLLEPLFTIADLADVGLEARTAAVALHAGAYSEASAGLLVLAHVREIFNGHERMATAALLKSLVARDDGPWAKWWAHDVDAGQIKSPASKLARLLRPFDVEPKQLKIDGTNERGYEASAFASAWDRYLDPLTPANDATTLLATPDMGSDLRSSEVGTPAGVKGSNENEDKSCPECGAWPHQGGHFAGCSRRATREASA